MSKEFIKSISGDLAIVRQYVKYQFSYTHMNDGHTMQCLISNQLGRPGSADLFVTAKFNDIRPCLFES
jgi:hypothetical protein